MHSSSLSKQRIKDLAKLKLKKFRIAEQTLIVEGYNLIKQLLDNGIVPLEVYCVVDQEVAPGIPHYVLSTSDMKRICDTDEAPNLAALYAIPNLAEHRAFRNLYLDGIRDPGNLGTIFRAALAFGIECIYLSADCCEVFSPKVVRASLGAVFCLPSQVLSYDELPKHIAYWFGTDVQAGQCLYDVKALPQEPWLLIIGSEVEGIRKELKEHCKTNIHIQMQSKMESLNAAVSTGIILSWFYQLVR